VSNNWSTSVSGVGGDGLQSGLAASRLAN